MSIGVLRDTPRAGAAADQAAQVLEPKQRERSTMDAVLRALALCCRVRSGPPFSHLLVATDVLSPGAWGGSQIAVCGAQLDPGSDTATEPDDDPGYCPACVRAAVRWNTRRARR